EGQRFRVRRSNEGAGEAELVLPGTPLRASPAHPGRTGSVFRVSSDLVTVPSAFSVTVFSFVFTEPSRPTVVRSSLEMVRSQPTNTEDSAKTDTIARISILCFMP